MKTLILVRHAKSSHSFGVASDFERPLTEHGLQEATNMGKKLLIKDVHIDQFVSSPAVRAKTTAEVFVSQYDRKLKEIVFLPALYHAAEENFRDLVADLDNEYDAIALFSHNPGITEYASSLSNAAIDHMPTCSVFAVQSDTESWKSFRKAEKKFLFFYKPE